MGAGIQTPKNVCLCLVWKEVYCSDQLRRWRDFAPFAADGMTDSNTPQKAGCTSGFFGFWESWRAVTASPNRPYGLWRQEYIAIHRKFQTRRVAEGSTHLYGEATQHRMGLSVDGYTYTLSRSGVCKRIDPRRLRESDSHCRRFPLVIARLAAVSLAGIPVFVLPRGVSNIRHH